MTRLYLCGWIRGICENASGDAEAIKSIEHLENYLGKRVSKKVDIFYFSNGASMLCSALQFNEVIEFSNEVAQRISEYSGKDAFYVTPSFWVVINESDIPHGIRSAKKYVDTHSEWGGCYFIDGRIQKITPICGAVTPRLC